MKQVIRRGANWSLAKKQAYADKLKSQDKTIKRVTYAACDDCFIITR